MSQIESEINQQSSETKAQEYDYGFSNNRIETLNASSIVNSVFLFIAKDWSEEDRKRLLMDDLECKLFDKAITPMVYNIAIRLGLAVAEVFSLVIIAGLLLPRIFVILSKNTKKVSKEVAKVGV